MQTVDEKIRQIEPYVSVDEVASTLRVTTRTVRNLCDRGEIEGARKVGRVWRIPMSYLHAKAA